MPNARRVQCGAAECARRHNNARQRDFQRGFKASTGQGYRDRFKRTQYERTCWWCDAIFLTAEHDAKFCSESCLAASRRADVDGRLGRGRSSQHPPDQVQARRLAKWTERLLRDATAGEYKRVVREDPCAYCATFPAGGVDHIDPASLEPNRSNALNMTGCCKRCNETKTTLALLLALPWIPLARAYHDQRRALFTPGGGPPC